MLKYTCNVEANQRHSGPGGGTRRLHHKHIMVLDEGNWCVYDGVEIGSTGVIENVELPVGDDRKSSNFIDANDNFASEDFALAA